MSDIIIQDEGAIRVITMNRPEKKNALTAAMYYEMTDVLDATASDAAIRVIVIAGAGGSFTSGNDLSTFLERGTAAEDAEPKRSGGATLLGGLLRNRKPLVAAVDGLAVGIGTTMIFHCDYVVASARASFSTPFVKLGLTPEGAATLLVPAAIGHHRAFELLAMGRRMDAAWAHRSGFVNELCDDGQALERALVAAREIAALPPQALALTRALMRRGDDEVGRRIEDELVHFNERMKSPEAVEAFRRFLKK